MQRLCTKKALFCNSPLRNDNIHIQDMHTHKPLRNALLMQRFAFRGLLKNSFVAVRSAYRYIAKCLKALQNARVKQRTPDLCAVYAHENKFGSQLRLLLARLKREVSQAQKKVSGICFQFIFWKYSMFRHM